MEGREGGSEGVREEGRLHENDGMRGKKRT